MNARTKRRDRMYRAKAYPYLMAHRRCEIEWDTGCTKWATEIDHKVARAVRPDLMLDETLWQATCAHCHRQKHANPAEAVERGYTLNSWDIP